MECDGFDCRLSYIDLFCVLDQSILITLKIYAEYFLRALRYESGDTVFSLCACLIQCRPWFSH